MKKKNTGFFISRYIMPAFLFIILVLQACAQTTAGTTFPLKLSMNGKYLVDKNNNPFLIKEISAWGLVQALSEKDEAAFVDSVKQKGFNTLMVSIISYDTRFAGNPPYWQGTSPFNTQWDFSTYNAKYFEHADRFLKMAEKKGMLVLLVPCYLGYKGDAKQGWWQKLLGEKNSVEKSKLYGEFIGKRYQGFNNIIWVAGGDNKGAAPLFDHMNNIIQGIKEYDKQHLWTGHFASEQGTNWAADNELYSQYIDINGLYVFDEHDMGADAPQYKTELQKYEQGKMIFQLDQSYEHDIPHDDNNENYQWIRRKNYDGLLSGCAGTSFSPGQKDNQCYVFTNWRPLMNTQGMKEMSYCFEIFKSHAWYKLVPINENSGILSGRGDFGTTNYVCAGRSADSATLMAYMPVGGTLMVNLNAMAGTKIIAWWYNVRTGNPVEIGVFNTTGTKQFTSPDNEDWLLVIDEQALNFAMPAQKVQVHL